MRSSQWTLRILLAIGVIATVVVSARNLPAGYVVEQHNTTVEIDGIDFGSFDRINGLDDSDRIKDISGTSYSKVTLTRDFVTDPSLYLWAKKTVTSRQGLKDIHLVKRNDKGDEISRYVLKLCQPLSWTVEAANPALGGFHEKVDLAVQQIEVY